MGTFLLRRLLLAIPTLFGVLVVVFALLYIAPGDPVMEMVGERADSATIAQLRKQLHLDDITGFRKKDADGHASEHIIQLRHRLLQRLDHGPRERIIEA